MAKDPATVAQRWATNLGGSTEKIKEGVAAVTVAPGQAAARQADVWASNVAASKPKWARRVAAVPLADWQAAMNGKGINRIASGASEAVPKMQSFLVAFLPHVEAGRRALPARGGLEQNIQRMIAMVRHNAQFQAGARGM